MIHAPSIGNSKELYDWAQLVTKAINDLVVTVSVQVGQSSGSSSADKLLVGGTIIGYYPAGNQDQFVDNILLNANGSITITLAANAVAVNSFNVVVKRVY